MFRRISTKLVLAVLAAVLLPFAAFAYFMDSQMADRLSRNVVRQSLLAMASDLAGEIDRSVEERNQDVELWASEIEAIWALEEHDAERGADGGGSSWGARATAAASASSDAGPVPEAAAYRALETRAFDRYVTQRGVYDLLLLVDDGGRLVACNGRARSGEPLSPDVLESLFARDFAAEDWFAPALAGRLARIDFHRSDLLRSDRAAPSDIPSQHHVAFVHPVADAASPGRPLGVLYALVNWRQFQGLVTVAKVTEYFRGLVGPDEYSSAYPWIWQSDANTIIGHPDPTLYGARVDGPRVGLPQMVEDALGSDWGLYREYVFRGNRKNAAFMHCAGVDEGGFGWVVGVGINNEDIYATVVELQRLLYAGTAVVVLVVILWAMVIARRTTSPIVALQAHTRRVAQGDLDSRVAIDSRDEVGELGRAFNQMTQELAEQRAALIKAEKDAAWREMARQIAHDIKNPLTPIKLSLDLLERARRDRDPHWERILDRTVELMNRQVDNLRAISIAFYEFTGDIKGRPEPIDLAELVDEVLSLNHAWAVELKVEVRRDLEPGTVLADRTKLRRVLVNLTSNALQAMPEGGILTAAVRRTERGGREVVELEIRDTGHGIPEDVRAHLFEPYFTTRSEGTGLGLAIAKRVVEEIGGTIEIAPVEEHDGRGTVARLTLPAAAGRPELPDDATEPR